MEHVEPIRNLLLAGMIVGLDPREMTLNVLEQLESEQNDRPQSIR